MARLLLIAVMLIPSLAFASGERERIEVLALRVKWGLTQKLVPMPDTPPNIRITTGVSGSAAPNEAMIQSKEMEMDRQIQEMKSVIDEAEKTLQRLKGLEEKLDSPPPTAILPEGPVKTDYVPVEPVPPMVLSFNTAAMSSLPPEDDPEYEAICGTADWCGFCGPTKTRFRYKKDENGEWLYGNAKVRVRFVNVGKDSKDVPYTQPEWLDDKSWKDLNWSAKHSTAKLPLWMWYDGKGEVRFRGDGHLTVNQLIEKMEAPRNDGPPQKRASSYAASGPAGAVHGSEQITTMIEWIDSHVGQGIPMQWRWDRTGAQTISLLLAGKKWSAEELFGLSGRFAISAPGAVNLPIDTLDFSYRIEGDDVVLDTSGVRLKGLAKSLGIQNGDGAVGDAQGIDPISTAWTVISIVRLCWQILHPQADLKLGGTVTATGVLNGDTLTVKFKNGPVVRLVMVFTFSLGVQQIVISPRNVHVDFTGSRWIKSRDFPVKSAQSVAPPMGNPLPRDPEPKTSVSIQKRVASPPGWHSHRCPFDGTVWSHSSSSYGSPPDHHCPKCGRLQWDVWGG